MTELPCFVFVYGTLKRGHWNNRYLADSQFFGEATLKDYVFLSQGIPFTRPKTEVDPPETVGEVVGEIWEVTDHRTLASLDRLEGHPNGYTRTEAEAWLGEVPVSVWVYHYYHLEEGQKVNENGQHIFN